MGLSPVSSAILLKSGNQAPSEPPPFSTCSDPLGTTTSKYLRLCPSRQDVRPSIEGLPGLLPRVRTGPDGSTSLPFMSCHGNVLGVAAIQIPGQLQQKELNLENNRRANASSVRLVCRTTRQGDL